MVSVAIQGVRGSFHDEAVARLLPDAAPLECVTFQDVFAAVLDGSAHFGVVAIENSLHGSINPVYRLLERHNVWVAGETTLQIEQYLIGAGATALADLQTVEAEVRTMFPAFAQCELWLAEHLPLAKRVELYDTAFSVQTVVDEADPNVVAIAGKHAAQTYGGEIITGPINDDPHNFTRFILLSRNRIESADANRSSFIITTSHSEGALFAVLQVLADAKLNISKLDSHPIPGDARHYAFYIDIDAGIHNPTLAEAMSALEQLGVSVKLLGSYHVD